jgi:hypothetical protein
MEIGEDADVRFFPLSSNRTQATVAFHQNPYERRM